MRILYIIILVACSLDVFCQGFSFKDNAFPVFNRVPSSSGGITNTTLGLVNWWKFDENTGTTAADSSDSATGTLTSSPVWIPGKINSALSFNGSAAFVQLATNSSIGSGAFTISAWIFPTNSSNSQIFFDSDDDNSSGFWLKTSGSANIYIRVVGSSSDLVNTSTDASLLNVWTFLVVSYGGTITDSSTTHIYTNCIETGYTSKVNGAGSHGQNTTSERYIGKGGVSSSPGFANGTIDDVRIYNRVLTSGEITNMFQWRGEP